MTGSSFIKKLCIFEGHDLRGGGARQPFKSLAAVLVLGEVRVRGPQVVEPPPDLVRGAWFKPIVRRREIIPVVMMSSPFIHWRPSTKRGEVSESAWLDCLCIWSGSGLRGARLIWNSSAFAGCSSF